MRPMSRGFEAWTVATSLAIAVLCGAGSAAAHTGASGVVRTDADAALQRLDVASNAYGGPIEAKDIPLTSQKDAARSLDREIRKATSALAKLRLSGSQRTAVVRYTRFLRTYGGILQAIEAANPRTVSAAFQRYLAVTENAIGAENQLRARLGLPTFGGDTEFKLKPPGTPIYSDSLAAPDSTTTWQTGPNVMFAGGGLTLTAPAGDVTIGSVGTLFTYDTQHVAVDVDATPGSGPPQSYGVICPGSQTSSELQILLGTNGDWYLVVTPVSSSTTLSYALNEGAQSAISDTGVNHLQVECDQFAPGLAIARVSDNGVYFGSVAAPLTIGVTEPGTVMESSASAAGSVLFRNWSVSPLPQRRSAES